MAFSSEVPQRVRSRARAAPAHWSRLLGCASSLLSPARPPFSLIPRGGMLTWQSSAAGLRCTVRDVGTMPLDKQGLGLRGRSSRLRRSWAPEDPRWLGGGPGLGCTVARCRWKTCHPPLRGSGSASLVPDSRSVEGGLYCGGAKSSATIPTPSRRIPPLHILSHSGTKPAGTSLDNLPCGWRGSTHLPIHS